MRPPSPIPRGERHRQHQRNRNGDDKPAAQPQREEADQQHDQDSFGERAHEFAHRAPDRRWLISHLVQIEPDRQAFADTRGGGFEIMAERDDVAAGAHRNRNADGLLALEAHARLRRIDESALDLGDVTEAEQAAIAATDAEVADRLD